jgi:dCMP deaminase
MTIEEIITLSNEGEEIRKAIVRWDHRFLDLARYISQWSKDPSTKLGAVVVDGRRVVSVGYNGFAQGVEDTDERLNNRELKYKMVVHGEMNAIAFAREPLIGYTLYTVPFMPCSVCAGIVIQKGIKRVVASFCDNPRWNEAFKLSEQLFKEAGVELILYDQTNNIEETKRNSKK